MAPAPLRARLVAALLDGAFGIGIVALAVRDEDDRPWLGGMLTARGGLGIWCGVGWLYTVIFESSPVHATFGKVVVNTRVEPVGAGRAGVRAAAVRNALRLVDLQPCLGYLVGWVAAMRSPLRQRLGDRAAGCVVVRHRFPPAGRGACLVLLASPVAAVTAAYARR